jgi:hypothetical protein
VVVGEGAGHGRREQETEGELVLAGFHLPFEIVDCEEGVVVLVGVEMGVLYFDPHCTLFSFEMEQ